MMNRNERIQRRYEQIYNATGDSKLSNKYKHYSNERIYAETGVSVNLEKPLKSKRTWTERAKKHAKRRQEKFNMGRELGFSVEDSKYLAQYRKERFENTKEYRKVVKAGLSTEAERKALWKKWSGDKGKGMPVDIVITARNINKQVKAMESGRKLPHNASYGYGYIYWAWVQDKSPQEIQEGMEPNMLEPYIITYSKDEIRRVK